MLRFFVLAAIATIAVSLAPRNASAQILGRIKQQTTEKLKEKKKAADDKVVGAAGQVVDSVAEKSARGVDSVVTKTSNTLNAAVDKTEQTVAGAFKGDGENALARQLAAGHVVLTDIRFMPDGTVDPASLETIRSLAKLMKAGTDTWVIEAHVAAVADDQALSEQRARVIKGTLVEEGVDMSRIFARGFGSTRPAAGATAAADRIEIVRMQ